MRHPVYSLRTGILVQLVFLIIAAMLLINVVMIKLSERDLIHAKIQTGKLLVRALEQDVGHRLARSGSLSEIGSDSRFRLNTEEFLRASGFTEVTIINRNGSPIYDLNPTPGREKRGLQLARKAMGSKTRATDFLGTTWGVIWLNKRDIHLSAPLFYEGRIRGGLHVGAPLNDIYRGLRKTEKIILLYILLDTIVLALVGIFLLSRIVVKPIHELLKMTAEYKEGDLIPSVAEAPGNEIGQLTRSLNHMLKGLDEGKEALKVHIASLEEANRELKLAQREIIKSEKLASVGRLAAGIAHEIGNPIGVVLGYLELFKKGGLTEEEKEGFFDRMESEITRINRIIRHLLDFSRPSKGKHVEIHIHELIRSTVNILTPQPMMDDIELTFELKAADDKILADPNQLQQVFLNIIMNAADACAKINPQGPDSSGSMGIMSRNTDDTIEVRFKDNGPGLPEDQLAHISDPFYTTKDPGEGTGLGLSVSYRIIEDMGGRIGAESVVGEGMTIIITLPLQGSK